MWTHLPEKLDKALKEELNILGKVAYLISPNKLHHLFLSEWISAYPNAKCYASPALVAKRRDIKFIKELSNSPENEWADEIKQTVFQGSPIMQEVVFFHIKSKTLILTDLIENFHLSALNWWQKTLACCAGILSPDGKTPIDWSISFLFGKTKARTSLDNA